MSLADLKILIFDTITLFWVRYDGPVPLLGQKDVQSNRFQIWIELLSSKSFKKSNTFFGILSIEKYSLVPTEEFINQN